jgi:hypothetical protein
MGRKQTRPTVGKLLETVVDKAGLCNPTMKGQEMLPLSSPRWGELHDAYGSAAKIPALLRQLWDFPGDDGSSEPWFSLWSALAHQGDVYSASFAAVPHVIDAIASSPGRVTDVYFHFPAWIEICRHKNSVDVPDELAAGYFDALKRVPALVATAAERQWSAGFSACALSATAAAKGQHKLAEALLELVSPDTVGEFLEWSYDR